MKDSSITLISAIFVLIALIFVSEVVIDADPTVNLHVESNSYYDVIYEEDNIYADDLLRNLKRSSSSSSSSSSSRSSGSYGNCYGDRCDNAGGSTDVAIIVGCVVGGLCGICIIYYLIDYCIGKRKKALKKARKKRNKIGPASESDSDAPKEPIVIYNDDTGVIDYTQ